MTTDRAPDTAASTPQTPTEPFAAGGDCNSVIGETATDGSAPGLATTGAHAARPQPPFYRGELGAWPDDICDRIVGDDACDAPAAYLVEWKQRPEDGETIPLSGCCETHARDVDRSEVTRMNTHPGLPAVTG